MLQQAKQQTRKWNETVDKWIYIYTRHYHHHHHHHLALYLYYYGVLPLFTVYMASWWMFVQLFILHCLLHALGFDPFPCIGGGRMHVYVHTSWSYIRVSSNMPFLKLVRTTLVNWGAATVEAYIHTYTYTEGVFPDFYIAIYTRVAQEALQLSEAHLLLQEWYSSVMMSV